MAIRNLTRDNLTYYCDTLNRIQTDQQRQWGQLSPAGLMCHLQYVVECSLENGLKMPDQSTPVLRTFLKRLFFEWWTNWPKGRIKAPKELTPEPEGDLEAERKKLLGLLDRFVEELERDPDRKAMHILLGPISVRYFARVHGVHFHHHFRQFGVV